MPSVIASTAPGLLISIEYAPNGLDWARLYDNPILGWVVDEAAPADPQPVVIGQLPTPAAATAPVISPQWAHFVFVGAEPGAVFVPDLWRGATPDFFTWLATNNGAARPLAARFGCDFALQNPMGNLVLGQPGAGLRGLSLPRAHARASGRQKIKRMTGAGEVGSGRGGAGAEPAAAPRREFVRRPGPAPARETPGELRSRARPPRPAVPGLSGAARGRRSARPAGRPEDFSKYPPSFRIRYPRFGKISGIHQWNKS